MFPSVHVLGELTGTMLVCQFLALGLRGRNVEAGMRHYGVFLGLG